MEFRFKESGPGWAGFHILNGAVHLWVPFNNSPNSFLNARDKAQLRFKPAEQDMQLTGSQNSQSIQSGHRKWGF